MAGPECEFCDSCDEPNTCTTIMAHVPSAFFVYYSDRDCCGWDVYRISFDPNDHRCDDPWYFNLNSCEGDWVQGIDDLLASATWEFSGNYLAWDEGIPSCQGYQSSCGMAYAWAIPRDIGTFNVSVTTDDVGCFGDDPEITIDCDHTVVCHPFSFHSPFSTGTSIAITSDPNSPIVVGEYSPYPDSPIIWEIAGEDPNGNVPCESGGDTHGVSISEVVCTNPVGDQYRCAQLDLSSVQRAGKIRIIARDEWNPDTCYWCSGIIELTCPDGPENLTLSASAIPADDCNDPKIEASVSSGAPVTWSFVTEGIYAQRGCEITNIGGTNNVTCDIVNCSEPGSVKVRASNSSIAGCYVEKEFTVYCNGPKNLRPDDAEVCPNGRTILRVDNNTCVTWSIEGDALDVNIVPLDPNCVCCVDGAGEQAAELIAGEMSGTVTIVVRSCVESDCPDQRIDVHIGGCGSGGCRDCNGGDDGAGSGNIILQSAFASFNMGKTAKGDSAGWLELHAEAPSALLPTPQMLRFNSAPEDVDVYKQTFMTGLPVIRQVKAPAALADLIYDNAEDESYEIRFYSNDQVTYAGTPTEAPWTINTSEAPFVTWLIERPSGAPDYNTLHVSKYVDDVPGAGGAVLVAVYRFEYSENLAGTEQTWVLRTGEDASSAVRTETLTWTEVTPASEWTKHYLVEQDGGVYAETTETWIAFSWGRALTERAVQTEVGVSARVTTYGYYTGTYGTPGGRMKYRFDPDGSWNWYEYASNGRLQTVYGPWGDYAPTPESGVNPSLCTYRTYTYPASAPHRHRPESIDEYVLGVLVASTEYDYSTAGGKLTVTERRCSNSGCSEYLETVRVYTDLIGHEIESVEYPDGRLDTYQWSEGTYADSGAPSASAFTPSSGGAYDRLSITHGTLTDPNGILGQMSRSVTVYSPYGKPVLNEMHALGASGHERISWTVYRYDERDRLLSAHYSNGTSTSQSWDSCCGLVNTTDMLGIVTSVSRDLLGRETSRIVSYSDSLHEDITTTTAYTISSGARVVSTATSHSGSSTDILTSEQQTDLAGQMLSSTDAAGLETTYAYANTTAGGRKIIVTLPGGQAAITCYWRDGRMQVEEGDGVTSRYHTFGAAAGQVWTKVFEGATDDSSPRWTKTTYDMLGRAVIEERPAFGHGTPISTVSTYDTTTGRLLMSEFKHDGTLLVAPTLYEYSDMGDVVRSGLDIGENGTLDLASLDRINDTQTSYVKLSGEWWRETIQKTYRTANSNTPSTVSTVRERLTGLGSGTIAIRESRDAYNNKTVVTSVLTASPGTITETVDLPGTDETELRVSVEGRLRSATDRVGLVTSFAYDGFGRQVTVTDSRGNPSTTCYEEDTGRVDCSKDGADHETEYTYYTTGTNIGRMYAVTNPVGKHTYYDYDDRGQVTHVWGDIPQPVTMIYDAYGERTGLVTFRDDTFAWSGGSWPAGADPNDGDRTTWNYDEATGLLTQKRYADNNGPDYDYTVDGRLAQRQWARTHSSNRLATTYTYYSTSGANTGELKKIEYDNEPADAQTPDVEYTYTRTGQLLAVADGVGARAFAYDAYGQRITELFENDPNTCLFPGKLVTTDPDFTITYYPGGGGIGLIVHQYGLAGIKVGTSGSPTADYEAEYEYDGDTARMTRVLGPGLPNNGANYTYDAYSPLVTKVEYKQNSTVQARITRGYHDELNLLTLVKNEELLSGGSPVIVSNYAYANDELNRRTSVVRTGSAFATSHHDAWSYNDRNELVDSLRFNNTDPNSPASADNQFDRRYRYDPIGNRTKVKTGSDPNEHYCVNNLNQYTATGASVGCGSPSETFSHDLDGNLESDGGSMGASTGRTFTWDGENRLIRVAPTAPQFGDIKVEFAYDYLGRRVEKVVHTWALYDPNDPNDDDWSATPSLHKRWIWHDWLCVMEYDVSAGPTLTAAKKYTWGLDLGGSGDNPRIDSAGGIGGLLAVRDAAANPAKSYYYFYDGNGNVGQVIDRADGSVDAKYEYDAYGNYLTKSGTFANDNPWRFSTKYWDDETGLGYWGYRYYAPDEGRWVNRDPIGEDAGGNLYHYAMASPAGRIDALGDQDSATTPESTGCCGADVTIAISNALARTQRWVLATGPKSNNGKCNQHLRDICRGIFDTKQGWDILPLHEVGAKETVAISGLANDSCGTGSCEGTVKYRGKCVRANELNYVLWGKLNSLCHEHLEEFATPAGVHESGIKQYRDNCSGGIIFYDYTELWSTWIIYPYRLGVTLGLFRAGEASAAGPGTSACRAAWTLAGYRASLGGVDVYDVPDSCLANTCKTSDCCDLTPKELGLRIAGRIIP